MILSCFGEVILLKVLIIRLVLSGFLLLRNVLIVVRVSIVFCVWWVL